MTWKPCGTMDQIGVILTILQWLLVGAPWRRDGRPGSKASARPLRASPETAGDLPEEKGRGGTFPFSSIPLTFLSGGYSP